MTTIPPPDEPLPDEPPPTGRRIDDDGSVRVSGRRTPDRPAGVDPATRTGGRPVNPGWYLLLLVPFVALLWLPFYARRTPELFGFPFFYWYQFAWVFLGAAITGLVYALTTTRDEPRGRAPDDGIHIQHRGGGRP